MLAEARVAARWPVLLLSGGGGRRCPAYANKRGSSKQRGSPWAAHRKSAPLLVCVLGALCLAGQSSGACQRVYFGARELNNIACKCDSSQCDESLEFSWPADGRSLVRLTSSAAGQRFELASQRVDELRAGPNARQAERLVVVDLGLRRQQVAGYGAALTDSAAVLLGSRLEASRMAVGAGSAHSNETLGQVALRSYFGPAGLNFNMLRVPVGGTDMSWRAYSCADLSEAQLASGQLDDFELANFRLQAEDLEHKLPLIERIIELREQASAALPLRMIMTSWSAPNWMKSQRDLVQGHLRGSTGGAYYDAYARYLIRFIDEYERHLNERRRAANKRADVRVWAMTPQNEPHTPARLGRRVVNYNSVNFSPEQMHEYISENLVPNLLRSNRSSSEFALFVWDDTLLGLGQYSKWLEFADEPAVRGYVRGLALHWYSQALDKVPYSELYALRRTLPRSYALLSTEASFIGRPRPGEWARGERYARDMIENLRAGSVAWLDWNLALNMAGGPTWSGNYLDAAMLVDEHAGALYKNAMFYAMGHVSRFVRAGAHVLDTQVYTRAQNASAPHANWTLVDELAEQTSDLLAASGELAPDDDVAGAGQPGWRRLGLVLLNRADEARRVELELRAGCRSELGARRVQLELAARSLTSLAFNC